MASSTLETIPTPANHTDNGDMASSTHGTITPTPATHTDHGELITHGTNTGTSEKLTAYTKNTAPKPKTTSIPTSSTNKLKNITLTTETIKTSVKTTINPARNTGSTETGRPTVKVTGDRPVNVTSPHPNKTEVNSQVPIGSLTVTTSSTELKLTTSEAPDKMSHPYQDKDGSQGGLNVGVVGENDSFPVWAIVIVVLLAVILFLVFLGLIFLVSYMTRKRHALIQKSDDNNSEDDHGPNSYPVYLMEQQTLGMGKIPRPQ
ncbi:mucin-like protein 3 [Talpa occidentalis]|uniref:mucin-like protein 3 n=1 Tax=Talpa occidentalis TaxID=50954 RepID=UPI00188E3460|nr:mucin-like protein 3 [Talpa occidentalis]